MPHRSSLFLNVLALSLLPFLATISSTTSPLADDFYKGKQITVIVGNPAGSGYDAYARLLTRHMGKYLPGNPTFIVEDMPGAGSINAAQYLAHQAPKDGTAFGILVPGAIFEPLIQKPDTFRYKPGDFQYVGSADSGTRLCFTTKSSGIKTIADARNAKVIVASTAPQSSATDYALFMNALAGTKFDVVMGYKGPADLLLAMERGEAAGICALDSATLNSIRPEWLDGGQINLLVQAGLEPSSDIKAPPLWDFITGDNRAVAEFIVSQQEFSRPFMAPPGTPPERVKQLRDAFSATMKDPELKAEAAKMRLGVDAKSGEEVSSIIAKLYSAPKSLVARAKEILRP